MWGVRKVRRRVCPECFSVVRDDVEDFDWVVCRLGHRIERFRVRRD